MPLEVRQGELQSSKNPYEAPSLDQGLYLNEGTRNPYGVDRMSVQTVDDLITLIKMGHYPETDDLKVLDNCENLKDAIEGISSLAPLILEKHFLHLTRWGFVHEDTLCFLELSRVYNAASFIQINFKENEAEIISYFSCKMDYIPFTVSSPAAEAVIHAFKEASRINDIEEAKKPDGIEKSLYNSVKLSLVNLLTKAREFFQ